MPDPTPALKSQLAQLIVERLDGFDVVVGAQWLRTDPARLSRIRNGRLEEFSLQRLVRLLANLGDEVTMTCTSRDARRVQAQGAAAVRGRVGGP